MSSSRAKALGSQPPSICPPVRVPIPVWSGYTAPAKRNASAGVGNWFLAWCDPDSRFCPTTSAGLGSPRETAAPEMTAVSTF